LALKVAIELRSRRK